MNPSLRIFNDLEPLSRAAADLFVKSAKQAVEEHGRFLVALSGGNTPIRLYRLLATEPYQGQIGWRRTHIFWGDERCVPPEDTGSSCGQAKQALLDHVGIPADNIHRIRGELGPALASAEYANTLKDFAEDGHDWPRFDLVLLGMGDDGHTASLFPGSEVNPDLPAMPVTAQYQDRPANRVTLTPKVFNSARQVIFLVTGESKAVTLARVLSDDYQSEELPAQRIHPLEGMVTWLVDETAASKLPKK